MIKKITLLFVFSLFLTLLISAFSVFYKKKSAAYQLMQLNKSIVRNDTVKIRILCNLEAFADTFLQKLNSGNSYELLQIDSIFKNKLENQYYNRDYYNIFLSVHNLFSTMDAVVVKYKEECGDGSKFLYQYIKIRGKEKLLVFRYFFEKKDNMFQLQFLEAIALTQIQH